MAAVKRGGGGGGNIGNGQSVVKPFTKEFGLHSALALPFITFDLALVFEAFLAVDFVRIVHCKEIEIGIVEIKNTTCGGRPRWFAEASTS